MRTRSRLLAAAGMLAVMAVAASCAPPASGGGPKPVNWAFRGTNITVNNVQDEVCIIFCVNTEDEPYLIQVAFRVKIGAPNSAQAWVVKGSRIDRDKNAGGWQDLGAGQSATLVGGEQAQVNFDAVKPLDVLDALKPSNQMEIVGTYTWAAEEDFIDSLSTGANGVANIFKDALNATLASSTLPSGDANALIGLVLDLLFNNVGSAFRLILSNIPCLGLCDDVLAGRVYVGLGATGALASIIDGLVGGTTVPSINFPGWVPPDIQGGGLYTLGGTKNFTGQTFSGADGVHTYAFQSAAA